MRPVLTERIDVGSVIDTEKVGFTRLVFIDGYNFIVPLENI